ncbi:MAG TPA: GNAT family N-acetyltransferase [Acidimicrobiia bacterium]|nr:GNAT family N-acetyltransferase [Acidimicrobiia bacterium]
MSWAALSSDTVSVAESPLETRRFGLDVARVNVGLQADIEVERLAGILEELSTDLAIVRYPASKVTWAHTLANRLDGVVFHADTLIYWHLALSGRPIPDPVQGATSDLDPESVASSVGRIFADYSNHYSANPRLNDRLALDGYQEWAANSASAGNAITLVSEGETIAVATVEAGDGYLEILLAGVEPNRQGRGEYVRLLQAVERRAAGLGVDEVYIATQAGNIRVQRAWARYGFRPAAAFETVHHLRE